MDNLYPLQVEYDVLRRERDPDDEYRYISIQEEGSTVLYVSKKVRDDLLEGGECGLAYETAEKAVAMCEKLRGRRYVPPIRDISQVDQDTDFSLFRW